MIDVHAARAWKANLKIKCLAPLAFYRASCITVEDPLEVGRGLRGGVPPASSRFMICRGATPGWPRSEIVSVEEHFINDVLAEIVSVEEHFINDVLADNAASTPNQGRRGRGTRRRAAGNLRRRRGVCRRARQLGARRRARRRSARRSRGTGRAIRVMIWPRPPGHAACLAASAASPRRLWRGDVDQHAPNTPSDTRARRRRLRDGACNAAPAL